MNKKTGNTLLPGIYKVFWKGRKGHKIQGWTWCAIGDVYNCIDETPRVDRELLSYNWSGSLKGSRMWRKIAKVERAELERMKGERT